MIFWINLIAIASATYFISINDLTAAMYITLMILINLNSDSFKEK